ncbi:hypothetical protein [Sphingomonas phyllosphaerae]|uniref:hypothetical protein n=1 Tax=Sphingomonas phyllosphaerae TaxID=257003 RepID=UPI002413A7C1|nr:hypothetical protein [Sphingomonas phyllosphaerae]
MIEQFMWGYQRHFRVSLRLRAEQVLKRIGLDVEPVALLIGVRRDGVEDQHPLCIEPDDERWSPVMFPDIHAKIEQAWRAHPDQHLVYGDEQSMNDKPEHIRRACISSEVKAALDIAEAGRGLRIFCSTPTLVEGHYVVCVLQLPEAPFEPFPPFPYTWMGEQQEASFLLRCIRAVLADAERALTGPDPGRSASGSGEMRPADELIREAAESFLRVPVIPGEFAHSDMFRAFNQLSQLMYEGTKGLGRLVLAKPNDPAIDYVLRLQKAVPFSQTRWVRKLLQMATRETVLVANYQSIWGLARVPNFATQPFCVDFLDQHEWEFRRGEQLLLRTRFGEPRLPQEVIATERFAENLQRLFPGITDAAIASHRAVLDQMGEQDHGSMVIIADDAASEAARLDLQGTHIEPVALTPELMARASRIDGTILVDPAGICHAIGVILDGQANAECTPSRGARYNSAVRYVGNGSVARMALVVSEDRTLDIIPLLRPRVRRQPIVDAVEALTRATVDNFHAPRNTLDKYRFYLSLVQCNAANAALDRIDAPPLQVGEIRYTGPRFSPDPHMDDSYLID